MKHINLTLIMFLFFSSLIYGQDVIVKHDGTSIISKVLEVNNDYVKYKKISNLDGPTYSISVSDILSINYANGERDMFNRDKSNNVSNSMKSSDEDNIINDGLISNYNDRGIILKKDDSKKKPKWLIRLLNVHQQSIMGNTDGKIGLSIDSDESGAKIFVSFENTSDEMIYIDLGNCTFRRYNASSTYFVNSSTTTSRGRENGAVVNMGSIASAIGVGGVVGSLASGVNVGGNNSSISSTTIYADRIITLAPHSKYFFSYKSMYIPLKEKPYKKDFILGDRRKYISPKNLKDAPWEIIISYVKGSKLEDMKTLNAGLYIKEEIPVRAIKDDNFQNDLGIDPLYYYYDIDR